MIDNKITIKDDEKVNIQRGAIGHRSTWTGLTYKYAAEAGKAEEAEKIIRQAISETGRVQGNALREQCPDPTSCKSFCDTMFTPTLLKSFEVDVKEKTDDVLDVEFHHCPLLKAWQDLGFDDEMCAKLCDIAIGRRFRNIAKAMGFRFPLGRYHRKWLPDLSGNLSQEKISIKSTKCRGGSVGLPRRSLLYRLFRNHAFPASYLSLLSNIVDVICFSRCCLLQRRCRIAKHQMADAFIISLNAKTF